MVTDAGETFRPRRPTKLSTAIGWIGCCSLVAGMSFFLGWALTDSGGRMGTSSSDNGPRASLIASFVLAAAGALLVYVGQKLSPRAVSDDVPAGYQPPSYRLLLAGVGASAVVPLVVTSALAEESSQRWVPVAIAITMPIIVLLVLGARR